MSLNETVSAERLHIGFFGVRNAGKSSLVNAVTNQELSVVSEVRGTTTDPVKKAMELLPLGPVLIIDTPGLDDEGGLGEKRVRKARQILAQTDIAVLVADGTRGRTEKDEELIALFEEKKLPYIVAYNKSDLVKKEPSGIKDNEICVSAVTGENITELKEKLGAFAKTVKKDRFIVADLLDPGDVAVLVVPVDESAPKGRLILPQQQTMREILDMHCAFITCQPQELKNTLAALNQKPRLVITDSQAFKEVARDTPDDIRLTSFSILFARYKGSLPRLVEGAAKLSRLKNGDKVLICEGCTHHRQCNDIGAVKFPYWIEQYSGAKPDCSFTSGVEFPEDLSPYALVIHCGGCMLNEQEMKHRIGEAVKSGVPIVNYGIAIAQMSGILPRSLQPFPEVLKLLAI